MVNLLVILQKIVFFYYMIDFLGNVNIANIYERLLSKNTLRDKRRDSFDFQRVNLLAEDSICMVNLLVILQKIVFFLLHD